MVKTLKEVVVETEIAEGEIVAWVGQEWVLPVEEEGRWLFDESDIARIALIRDLRTDMAVNDEAIPIVLRLLDQLYSLRHALGELLEAVRELPPEHRSVLEQRLREVMEAHGHDPRG